MVVFRSARERRLWTLAGLLVATIYATLYSVRPVAEFLRERNLLRLAVSAAFLLTALVIIAVVIRRRPGWREVAVLVVAALISLAVLGSLSRPEERVHFLEYGLLAGLIYAALSERRRLGGAERGIQVSADTPAAGPAAGAVLLTTLLGWGDEGIQALLPNRVYELRDVAMNVAAALLLIGIVLVLQWARLRDRAAREIH